MLRDTEYYKDIYIFKMQDRIFRTLSFLSKRKLDDYKKICKKNNLKENVISFLIMIQEIAIYITFAFMVFDGKATIGQYFMYVTSIHTFYSISNQLIIDVVFIRQQNERISDFRTFITLDLEENTDNFESITNNIDQIEFNDVSFKYFNQVDYAVKNINLTISKNEKVHYTGHICIHADTPGVKEFTILKIPQE
jgi:ABC-type bacteriocin/lantibiotic exporter with double-glycine peptidase domain